MKTSGLKGNKLLISVIFFVTVLLAGGSNLTAQPFKLSQVSDLARVFEDGYKLPPLHDTINIFGIRGEIISGQCVFTSRNNLTNVTVEVSALKNQISGITLPAKSVEWNFVGSIPLTKNASNQPLKAVSRPAPARFPDYLMAEKQLNINKGMYQAVWLTISIPESAEAGAYAGKVTVKSTQGEQSLPIVVTIYPLIMPEERHLKVTEWYNTNGFSKLYGIKDVYSDEWFAMLRKYADNMVAHRQNVFEVPFNSIEIKKSKDGLEFNFLRFDQIAQVFWDTKKMNWLETGELTKFEKDWNSTRILFRDFTVLNSESGEKIIMPAQDVIPVLLPAFEDHLRQKGWLHKSLFHIKDEPSLHNVLSWLEASAYIHKYAPDLIRIDAVNTHFVSTEIEIAVPMLDNIDILYKQFRQKQQEGTELWFYTTGLYQAGTYPDKTIDMPVMDSRLMHWLNYKYDLSGYLHWGWNQWSENPFLDPTMHNGDGWHVYPAKDGVLNSLRWEQMRNGIQDYEYFWMLENKVKALKDSLGARFNWIVPSQRGKDITGNVVMSFTNHTEDPDVLYNTKKEVIKELLEFDKSPRIYVQMNPEENSVLKAQSAVEVFGWTEPGTKIIINRQEIPVSREGLFLKIFNLYPNRNTVTVQAVNEKGTKVLVHKYVVEE